MSEKHVEPVVKAVSDSAGNSDNSDHESAFEIDPAAEKRLVRKLDIHIIPLVLLLYLFSFLDRVNIGNAKLYGLEADLGLQGNQFQILVSVLFVTYITFELPSNLIVKKVGPSKWISFIALSWGLVATFSGLTQNFGGMLACRLLLGLFEGGFFPGMVLYLTLFYTKRELGLRIGYLFTCSAIAGATGGLLAYAIGFMDGAGGHRGWRWIMIIEGVPTALLGIAAYFLMADNPETASYLSAEEKALCRARFERQIGSTRSAQQFHWDDVKKGLSDWKVWVFAFGQFGLDVMLYGFSTFLPTIIKGINPTAKTAVIQAMTIPCYMLGAITYLVVGYLSDRQQKRGVYVALTGSISIVGYVLLMAGKNYATRYAGCFLVAMGMFAVIGLPLAWLPSHTPRYGKRSTTIALQAAIGNSAGIMSSFLYPAKQAPNYTKGHAITLSMVAYGVLSFVFMWAYYTYMNKRRAEGKEDHKIAGLTEDEIEELGDDSPRFVYVT
ncbi:major facilitator superfamily domain-containing protein [Coniochaeta sp. 2T2.1]|nr:major facilitator superfamily domain-containing protein [Coniochaeta sp. 2T2.1]